MKMKGYGRTAVASTFSVILATVTAATGYAQESASDDDSEFMEEIVVSGIRGSLKAARDQKRDARGIVDAISSEDIGKFPDTNLAESLQRVTGVSIDRQNGEGNRVTVRGFGADFNLVTLNGRQMPTSSIADGVRDTRSFDFANLAAENVAGVEIYKTMRASTPTGGIGSTINIKTARPLDAPGLNATIGAKAVYDDSRILTGSDITPEISGLYSNTFMDDRVGIALSGSYQLRDGGVAQANTANGWRGAYLGSENNWGTLPQPGTPGFERHTNRPGPDDVYATPQSLGYALNDIERERWNGAATLQFRPTDTLTFTADYTFAQNTISGRRNDVSVWFNHGETTTEWTDGPIAAPILYSEFFPTGTDLSFGGALQASQTEINSIGARLEWEPNDNFKFELDFHDSSSISRADSPFGSDVAIGSAIFGLERQSVRFDQDLPILSVAFPDNAPIDPSRAQGTGNAFRNSLQEADVNQVQFHGEYYENFDGLDLTVDFGAAYTENTQRSAFSVVQNDTWGGLGTPDDWPDDLWSFVDLPENFNGVNGYDDPALLQQFLIFDIPRFVEILDGTFGACGGDGICRSDDFFNDQTVNEQTWSGYVQVGLGFELAEKPANITAGLRYEDTTVNAPGTIPIPQTTRWVAENEFNIILADGDGESFVRQGGYDFWLPSIDFDIELSEGLIFRAAYSQSITRPNFGNLQGGLNFGQLFRIEGARGNRGNPALSPFASDNWDASLEYYYGDSSYVAGGYFRKNVDNFIGVGETVEQPYPGLTTPFGGERWQQAVTALGTEDANLVRAWIRDNTNPALIDQLGDDNPDTFHILTDPATDPTLDFILGLPVSQDSASVDGWEFAWQHGFGETGFGFQLNYTIVNGDVTFDRTQPASVTQFALLGLSDSANAVAFYDKDGLQARIAWNWRDEFLASTATGSGPNNPLFTEEYWQIDFNVSYDITENVSVLFEGINITNETQRVVGRSTNEANFVTQTGARYLIGARYRF